MLFFIPTYTQHDGIAEHIENIVTLQTMKLYGIENVCGGGYISKGSRGKLHLNLVKSIGFQSRKYKRKMEYINGERRFNPHDWNPKLKNKKP